MKQKQKSRKDLRKEKRKDKKNRIRDYHMKKSSNKPTQQPAKVKKEKKKKKIIEQINDEHFQEQISEQNMMEEEEEVQDLRMYEEDKQIQLYEKKLGISKDSKKYEKMAKNLGFDDDLFNFLDGITQKVKPQKNVEGKLKKEKKKKVKKVEKEEDHQIDEEIIEQIQKKQVKVQKKEPKEKKEDEGVTQIKTQIRKQMNSLFNKISDGNLMYTFQQFVNIFENNAKVHTVQTYCNLFVRFNVMIQKPLLHVLTANIVLAVSLHKAYGQRLMANILRSITTKYLELLKEQDDIQEVQQIGYSKIFQKRKNYIIIVCYLYEFGSISADFIYSLVKKLTQNLDGENIQFIYTIIQKCGILLRNRDISVLKQSIDLLKTTIQDYKKEHSDWQEHGKLKFIEIQINQIRFNRKNVSDVDQRMRFLHTFISKNVPKQVYTEDHILTNTFQEIANADVSIHNWWEFNHETTQHKEMQEQQENIKVQSQQIKQLKQIAKSYRFVTQVRKNIFIQIMTSKDYIEATQKILQMKVKKLEDVALVLVQVNVRQPTFNPFYALVSAKLASEIPKLRVSLQFALWDRFKQLQDYDARKISNLSKFMSWLISSQISNCSLSMLKYFPDLVNLSSKESAFLKVFFLQLLRKAKQKTLIKLSSKLKQDKNRFIREGIKEYLGEVKQQIDFKPYKQNIKLLKRLLQIQERGEEQN